MDPFRVAKKSPYGAKIAYGFLTLSLISLLTCDMSSEQVYVDGITQFTNNKARYMNPVRFGDKIRSNYHIVSIAKMRRTALRVIKEITSKIKNLKKHACVVETVTLIFF